MGEESAEVKQCQLYRQGEKDSRDRETQGEEAEDEKVGVYWGKRPHLLPAV